MNKTSFAALAVAAAVAAVTPAIGQTDANSNPFSLPGSPVNSVAPLPGAAPTTPVTTPLSTAAPTPGGALSSVTPPAPNTVLDLNAAAPPMPLMGTIVQEVAVTIDKVPIQRGPFVGLAVHLHNGTNSPLMFDGDRARVTVGGQVVTAISDATLEGVTGAPPTAREEARIGFANAITVGAASTIADAKREKGPILPRYGVDQLRREATLERFGTRILFPGDDTQGIIFFKGNCKLDAAHLELPVVTFPDMKILGYLSGTR